MAESRPGPYRESVGVTVDASSVGPYLENKTNAIRAILTQRADYWALRLQMIIVNEKLQGQLLKHRTGKLGDSVRTVPTEVTPDEITAGVTAGGGVVDYARSLEFGSQAHEIVAVNALALHFVIDGKDIFRKRVMHPGTRAYAYMRGTLDENAADMIADIQDAVGY